MKKFYLIFVFLNFLLLIVPLCFSLSLQQNEKKYQASLFANFPKSHILNLTQFKNDYDKIMIKKEKAYLLDVRTNPEFFAGHIQGTDHLSAGNIYTLPKYIKDPNVKIIVFCRTLNRSIYTVDQLMHYGYKNVWLFKGGIVAWIKKGYPLVNKFMGQFRVIDYHKFFSGIKMDPYRLRDFYRG